ncbi:hypothetical protein [Aliidiomarina indica]|uniref:hypothetical protein n=1 Tax=Aliidiomarina indica TaxID=2749147 RepID=UPI00188F4441|nr:hypothetical protein [Aliidiomarina indica]
MNDDIGLELATRTNLQWHVLFHNHVKKAMSANLNQLLESDEVDNSSKLYWKEVYSNQFSQELRKTTFLLFFGHLEETLLLLQKVKCWETKDLATGYGIAKFKPMIKELLGVPLGDYEHYELLLDAQLVRNSFLHVAGRLSISKDYEKLSSVLNKRKELYIVKHDRIQVTPKGLLKLQEAVCAITNDLAKGGKKVE